jgi:hypothetical protein
MQRLVLSIRMELRSLTYLSTLSAYFLVCAECGSIASGMCALINLDIKIKCLKVRELACALLYSWFGQQRLTRSLFPGRVVAMRWGAVLVHVG